MPEKTEVSEITKTFQCPECHESSTTEQWDTATAQRFGDGCISIDDAANRDECSYVCPGCNREIGGSAVVEGVIANA
jgi:hypothetical protein